MTKSTVPQSPKQKKHTTIAMKLLGTKKNAHEIKWTFKKQTIHAQTVHML